MTDSVSELGSDHKQPIRSHHQDSLTNERPLLTQCRSWGVKVRAGWLSGHQTSPPDGSNPRQTCNSYKSLRDYDYDISDKLLLLMLNCSWPMCWKNMAFTTLPKWSYGVKLIQRVGNDRAGDASTRRHGGLRVRSVEHENDNRGADSASLLNMGHWLSIPISIVKCQLKSFLSLEMKDIILKRLRDFLLPGLTVLE